MLGSESDRAMRWGSLDRLFADAVEAGRLSGAVALVWHRGALAHEIAIGRQDVAIGRQDVATGRLMRRDTLFRLYSMTKPVTAAAMMILWDEGRWSPNDSLAFHLPELVGLRDPYGRAADPTLEQLMTHQAGFAYGLTDDAADRALRAAGVPAFPHAIDAADYLDRLAGLPLAYEPGTGWRYSIAMDLQGLIVERLSGMSLHAFMRTRIFEPLGMKDTGFCVPVRDADRLATLYAPMGDALVPVPIGDFAPDPVVEPAMASGGAGLFSTADDYLRFGRMLREGGALDGVRVMSARAVETMRRSHTPPAILAGGFGTAPHWLRPGYEYGYNGIVVTDPQAAGVALGRGTYLWDGAAGCWFWSDPENDVVIVAMVQLLADAELLGLQFRSRAIVTDAVRAADRRSARGN